MTNYETIELNIDTEENIAKVAALSRALSSETRLKMLGLMNASGAISILDMAKQLDIAISSAAFHADILEKAGVIHCYTTSAKHGVMKMCSLKTKKFSVDLFDRTVISRFNTFTYNIPIGSYIDANILANPTCGLASEYEILELADRPSSFFSSRKNEAQIIWASHGYLVYKIPNYFLENNEPQAISFSLEICSEAPFYNLNYPSDITFKINDSEIFTYTSPSDFGGREGKLTPHWWNRNLTQYGELKEIIVNNDGAFCDSTLVNPNITIKDLKLNEGSFISFYVGIKDDAINKGGFNIFGEKFGDYEQNIIMRIKCL